MVHLDGEDLAMQINVDQSILIFFSLLPNQVTNCYMRSLATTGVAPHGIKCLRVFYIGFETAYRKYLICKNYEKFPVSVLSTSIATGHPTCLLSPGTVTGTNEELSF